MTILSSDQYFSKAKQSMLLMQRDCNRGQVVRAYKHAYRALLSAANAVLVDEDFEPSTVSLTLITFFRKCREEQLVSKDCLRTYSEVVSMHRAVLKNAELIDVEDELAYLASSVSSSLAEIALVQSH